jgi:hypothetical protein
VIVTVITMRMMQMAVDQIIDVVTVWYRFVTAAWTVYVIGVVASTLMCRSTSVWVGFTHFNLMFFNLAVLANVMQVPIVQVIDMPGMFDPGVFAVRTVLVVVLVCHSWFLPSNG